MKKILLPIFAILISTIVIAAIPTEAEAAIYEDTIRLHILAPSDSAEDQKLKLDIRDRLLAKYSDELGYADDIIFAKAKIAGELNSIAADCESWVKEAGFDYSATAELCEEWYGTREYSDFTLPQGSYTSLKITLGSGEGANWWCVMYPPMCLDVATEEVHAEYTDDEYRLISKSGYRVKFKMLEVINEIARGATSAKEASSGR